MFDVISDLNTAFNIFLFLYYTWCLKHVKFSFIQRVIKLSRSIVVITFSTFELSKSDLCKVLSFLRNSSTSKICVRAFHEQLESTDQGILLSTCSNSGGNLRFSENLSHITEVITSFIKSPFRKYDLARSEKKEYYVSHHYWHWTPDFKGFQLNASCSSFCVYVHIRCPFLWFTY